MALKLTGCDRISGAGAEAPAAAGRSGDSLLPSELLAAGAAASEEMRAVVRTFVEDVKLAYGTGDGDKIDEAGLDWPDLAETYRRALAVLAQVRA